MTRRALRFRVRILLTVLGFPPLRRAGCGKSSPRYVCKVCQDLFCNDCSRVEHDHATSHDESAMLPRAAD